MSLKSNIITNYIYFYHLDKFLLLPLYPDQINDSQDTTFQSTNALSRTAPVFTYSYSGPRHINIALDLHRDMMNDLNYKVHDNTTKGINVDYNNIPGFKVKKSPDGGKIESDDYIDVLINYLQTAALPAYNIYNNKSKSVDPPMVAIRFGNQIFIKGVITSGVQTTYKKPIMPDGKYAYVQITFSVSEVEPYDAKSITEIGSFRTAAAGFDINMVGSTNNKWSGMSLGDSIGIGGDTSWVNQSK